MKRLFPVLAVSALAFSIVVSCSPDKPDPTPADPGTYAIATVEGALPNFTTYFQTIPDLNLTSLDTKAATELANSSAMWSYGKDVYITSGAPPTIRKYSMDNTGNLTLAATLVGDGTRVFSTLAFRSATEAYATVYGQNQIIKFNPATMQKSGEIDVSSLYRKNSQGATMSMLMGGALIRDDKLFIPVHYESRLQPLIDSAFVAVIDMNAGKLEKLIRDGRSNSVYGNSKLIEVMTMDESKNIYVMAAGGGAAAKPSSVLRIKAGETEFDQSYFFDLLKGTGSIYCYGLYYFGANQAFTAVIEPTATTLSGFLYKFYRLDLASQKVIGVVENVPLTNASVTQVFRRFEDKKILFGVQAKDENAVYEYDMTTNTAQRKFKTTGRLSGLENLK